MRIFDIIKPDVSCYLHHPNLGSVCWGLRPIHGWGLFWAEGTDKDQFLVADEAVLMSDEWTEWTKAKMSTEDMADLLADALVPKCLKKEDFNLAVEIMIEEINVRKVLGDY